MKSAQNTRIYKKIQALLCELQEGLYDKNTVISIALLASIAGEGLFMLGPPGVGKSLVARRLKFAWRESAVFEYLMNRFSTPDEIFGPVSISKLKNEDVYQRSTETFLPEADIVFLDEIWKAGPAIQNALLTVLNEKIFKNGNIEMRVPLKTLIAASNDLPAEGEGLEALWDRFLLRVNVGAIKDESLFLRMINDTKDSLCDNISAENKITPSEYEEWQRSFNRVVLGSTAEEVILILKNEDDAVYISDRRWKKIARLLRVAAFAHERRQVRLSDTILIQHCIWNNPEEYERSRERVFSAILKQIYGDENGFETLSGALNALDSEVRNATRIIQDTRQTVPLMVDNRYYTAKKEAAQAYIQKEDYDSLGIEAKSIKIYKEIKLLKGYSKESGEPYITFDRDALCARSNTPFGIVIDGEIYTLVLKTSGDKRKIKRRAEKRKEMLWDLRLKQINEHILIMQKKLNAALKEFKNVVHLFVTNEDLEIMTQRIKNAQLELDSLLPQMNEVKRLYSDIEEGHIILETAKLP